MDRVMFSALPMFFVIDKLIRTFIFLHIRLKFPILVVVVIRLILIMHNQGHY